MLSLFLMYLSDLKMDESPLYYLIYNTELPDEVIKLHILLQRHRLISVSHESLWLVS